MNFHRTQSMKILLFVCAVATSATAAAVKGNGPNDEDSCNSKFVKVIANDTVYSTPAIVLFGKSNGDLVRCLHEDPGECEVFHHADSEIYSLLINGEYIYAGLQSGVILRCLLSRKHSCNVVYSGSTSVRCLAGGRGYLFAGLQDGIIRCELEHYSCQTLRNVGASSLIQLEQYLYAGSSSGLLMRCIWSQENSCTQVHDMKSSIYGLASMGNNIYATTFEGRLWKCSRKLDAATNHCTSVDLKYSNPWNMAVFNNTVYVHNYYTGICKWVNDSSCVSHVFQNAAWSMSMGYSTYHMQSRYENEHTVCAQQSEAQCRLVTYYNEQQRAALEVYVKDGRLYNSRDSLVDTSNVDEGHKGPAAMFAMGPDGRILLSNLHPKGSIHTSSFFAGNPVSGAGEIVVEEGVIKKILACSDHYKPDLSLNKQVVQSLRTQGYTDHIELEACCEGDECDEFSANIV